MNSLKYIPAAITAGASAYMAIHGVTGWGWFLFATLIFLGVASERK